MNEVEKMYENAGIEPTHYDACALEDKYWDNEELANQYGTLDGYLSFECPYYGEGCYSTCEYAYDKDEYPPFTAEKQIKIIEWLGNSKAFFDANETIFSLITNHKDKNGVVKGYEGKGNSVDSCLAGLINSLWQDLTDAERKQIKNILE